MRGDLVAMVMLVVLREACGQQGSQAPVVRTVHGLVRGKADQGITTFMGIPYARANRFEDPQDPVSWSGVRDSTSPGPQCPQKCTGSLASYVCVPQTSEDCLSVNVYAPERTSTELLPVMVWFHGGNFEFGCGGALIYNGGFLARVGRVLIVTTNYRMGAFGYMPVFDNATGQVKGNWGLKDQVAALYWVRNNIQAFGGDPNKVTIFGQSAGGQSVGAILTSPMTEQLFDRAVMQSAPITLPFRDYNDSLVLAKAFAKAIGCPFNDVTCYRQRPANLLVDKQKTVRSAFVYKAALSSQPWGPLLDGRLVTSSLADSFAAGSFHRKPLMLGYTTEEGLTYAKLLSKEALPPNMYRIMMTMLLPDDMGRKAVSGPYRPVSPRDARPTLSRAITDLIFACPARWVARMTSQARVPTFLYVFDQPISLPGGWGEQTICEGRTCHAVELPFLFNSPRLAGAPVAYEDYRLSYEMARRWTRFAWSGDPNESEFVGEKKWPPFHFKGPGPVKVTYVFRQGGTGSQSGHLDRYCNFWDTMGYSALGHVRSSMPSSSPAPPRLLANPAPPQLQPNPTSPRLLANPIPTQLQSNRAPVQLLANPIPPQLLSNPTPARLRLNSPVPQGQVNAVPQRFQGSPTFQRLRSRSVSPQFRPIPTSRQLRVAPLPSSAPSSWARGAFRFGAGSVFPPQQGFQGFGQFPGNPSLRQGSNVPPLFVAAFDPLRSNRVGRSVSARQGVNSQAGFVAKAWSN